MKKVLTSIRPSEAHIVRNMLEENGVSAHVDGDYLQGGLGELPAVGTASVSVNDDDYERAKKLIDKFDRGEMALEE